MANAVLPVVADVQDTGSNLKGENVSVHVTSIRLNKDNYLSWSAALEIGITSRGRLQYITGEKPAPAKNDPQWATWTLEDSQVPEDLHQGACYTRRIGRIVQRNHVVGIGDGALLNSTLAARVCGRADPKAATASTHTTPLPAQRLDADGAGGRPASLLRVPAASRLFVLHHPHA
ncbi:hypothetical protein EJ110_NYTH59360 [Nymphaea thermarum]|nr:hypothetical protein EJ110_NYTH59360 [Nymphaea thermarum]